MIYLYAIVEGLDGLTATSGVEGAPLELRSVEGLEAIVSRHERSDLEPSDAALLDHAEVVEAATARSTAILPARFGRGFADEAALEAALRSSRSELTNALRRVRRCVEIGVRVLSPVPQTAAAGAQSGAAYMHTRLRELVETEKLALEIHHALAERARESTRPTVSAGQLLLTASYLVPARAVDVFRAEVERLEHAHTELGFACTGPWPPYSFAALCENDA